MRFVRIILAALILAVCGACAADGTASDTSDDGPPPVPVTTATVVQKSMPLEIQVIGSAEPYSTVAIRSQITGQLLNGQLPRRRRVVQQGQVLFELDRRPLEAALQQAQANLARDVAQAANADVQAKRFQELVERGISPREQADTARPSVAALNATVEADRAAVENAKVQLQYATITAPISGRTGALHGAPGQSRARQRSDAARRHQPGRARCRWRSRFPKSRLVGAESLHGARVAAGDGHAAERATPRRPARSRSSTTPSIRTPARSASRARSPTPTAGSGPGSSSTSS